MILLCGIASEQPLVMVREALAHLNAPTMVFNQRHFATTDFGFDLSSDQIQGTLTIDGQQVDLAEITGIYIRLMDDESLPELSRLPAEAAERSRCRNLHDALIHWLEITPARVLNRCAPMASNASKPYQAQLILQQGFVIPETLITNDPDLVRDFCAQHGRVIYKSISGVRSIVQEVGEAELARLENIRWCPTQFQAFIEGTNVRVHVVGTEVFATKIITEVIDYRYARTQGGGTELIPVDLNDELSEKCIRLADALELPFAGIDLKVTPAGEVFCFEVNPSPGFSFYENQTEQPIALAVARYLCG